MSSKRRCTVRLLLFDPARVALFLFACRFACACSFVWLLFPFWCFAIFCVLCTCASIVFGSVALFAFGLCACFVCLLLVCVPFRACMFVFGRDGFASAAPAALCNRLCVLALVVWFARCLFARLLAYLFACLFGFVLVCLYALRLACSGAVAFCVCYFSLCGLCFVDGCCSALCFVMFVDVAFFAHI